MLKQYAVIDFLWNMKRHQARNYPRYTVHTLCCHWKSSFEMSTLLDELFPFNQLKYQIFIQLGKTSMTWNSKRKMNQKRKASVNCNEMQKLKQKSIESLGIPFKVQIHCLFVHSQHIFAVMRCQYLVLRCVWPLFLGDLILMNIFIELKQEVHICLNRYRLLEHSIKIGSHCKIHNIHNSPLCGGGSIKSKQNITPDNSRVPCNVFTPEKEWSRAAIDIVGW